MYCDSEKEMLVDKIWQPNTQVCVVGYIRLFR